MSHDDIYQPGARLAQLQQEFPRGMALLHDPLLNHGSAFTAEERAQLGLRGLLPPRVLTQELQAQRNLENFHKQADNLQRYIYMIELGDRNETLFYYLVINNLELMMPIIYTPTVGKACQEFGHIFRRPRGLYISAEDRGRVAELLANWPHDDVRVIVITDGERILGLGDLGANGMGIPVGKTALYTACGGVNPAHTLPVMLDVGTENARYLADPLYLGLSQQRVRGEAYDALVEEFVLAVQQRYPRALIQFEDFANHNAFRLLQKYRDRARVFNDDIQGTAAVTLAGLYSAVRVTGGSLADQTFLFLGAGEAGVGIADLIVSALVEDGLNEADARRRCWFVDSHGLVVASRSDLAAHKRPYAHDAPFVATLDEAVAHLRPTALLGVSGQPRTFTEAVVRAMAVHNDRPIIFALSNPTANAECTAAEAYGWSDGRAIFASGSPFPPFELDERTLLPGQANNAYVFPGIGLGVVISGARHVTDEMFMVAARTLAGLVQPSDLEVGRMFPPLPQIRDISAAIATAVAQVAYRRGLATEPEPADLEGYVRGQMYVPVYRNYVTGA